MRQRETEHEWGRVRERETQNLKQAPGSEPSARSLLWILCPPLSLPLSFSLSFKNKVKIIYLFYFYFFNIYLFLRQRESMNRGGSERGRHRIWNRPQALSCQHRARRGARTHGPWDHDLSRSRTLNRPSHPGAPKNCLLTEYVKPGANAYMRL